MVLTHHKNHSLELEYIETRDSHAHQDWYSDGIIGIQPS